MPRRTRVCPPGIPQHIIQRGNNRQPCFVAPEDYAAYAHWLREHASELGVQVHVGLHDQPRSPAAHACR
jgi:putative transposase